MEQIHHIFDIRNETEFLNEALQLFHYQFQNNPVYRAFADGLRIDPDKVRELKDIPFLPIEFFKTHTILPAGRRVSKKFTSSGTTGTERGYHFISDLELYDESLLNGFIHFYHSPSRYRFLSLTPFPEQNPESSLIYMIQRLMKESGGQGHGFYLEDFPGLHAILNEPEKEGRINFLIGLTYSLLDFTGKYRGNYPGLIVMETGGMKGRKVEMTRGELHRLLLPAFGASVIHSEYGMTELLSQAYSDKNGIFRPVPWMKILIREITDPLSFRDWGKTGGINVIDLANIYSCPFIATQDLGRVYPDGSFEVLGRFDSGDIRGCSLMAGDSSIQD